MVNNSVSFSMKEKRTNCQAVIWSPCMKEFKIVIIFVKSMYNLHPDYIDLDSKL